MAREASRATRPRGCCRIATSSPCSPRGTRPRPGSSCHAPTGARRTPTRPAARGPTGRSGRPSVAGARLGAFLDARVAEMRTRLRRRRLICREEPGARVNGRTPWAGVFQHTEVCGPVIRPSRGHRVIREILGDPRPTSWVSDLYSAQQHHPAEDWQVCLAHHLRDCPCALEAGDTVCAPRMQALLVRACAMHPRRDTLAASTRYQDRGDRQRRVDRC